MGPALAKWVGSRALLQQRGVSLVWILGMDMALLMGQCWGSIHMLQAEGSTTKKNIHGYVLGGCGDKKKRQKKNNNS